MKILTKNVTFVALAFISLFAAISLGSAHTDSITFDEIAHIASGYTYLTENDLRLNPEHPPLLKVLAALPLLVMDFAFPLHDMTSWNTPYDSGEYGQWDAGRLLLHGAGNDTDKLIFWTRVPMILLFAGFSFFLFTWGRRIGGVSTALVALTLWLTNPNILAHNHLITTDIGAAAAISVTFFFLIRFAERSTWRNAIFLGIVFGVANAIKFSAIIITPFLFFVPILYFILARRNCLTLLFVQICTVGVIALLTIFIIYIPFSFATPQSVLDEITPRKIHGTEKQIDIWTRESILAVNSVGLLRPSALYLHGVAQVFHRVAGGNRTYFMGNVSSDADPLYFPTVFLLKETLPHLFFYTLTFTLIAIVSVRGIARRCMSSHKTKSSIIRPLLREHFTEVIILIFVVFYLLLAVGGNLTIGIRHLFPIFPLLTLLTAITLTRAYRKVQSSHTKKLAHIVAILGGCFLVVHAIALFPSYLSYFNPLAGGTENGYRYAVDSNADWGQGSKRLENYLVHNDIDQIRVDYFGGDDISARLGDRMIPWWSSKRPVEPGYYALSTTLLQDSIYDPEADPDTSYAWTRDLTPIAQIDSSILIYHIPEGE